MQMRACGNPAAAHCADGFACLHGLAGFHSHTLQVPVKGEQRLWQHRIGVLNDHHLPVKIGERADRGLRVAPCKNHRACGSGLHRCAVRVAHIHTMMRLP